MTNRTYNSSVTRKRKWKNSSYALKQLHPIPAQARESTRLGEERGDIVLWAISNMSGAWAGMLVLMAHSRVSFYLIRIEMSQAGHQKLEMMAWKNPLQMTGSDYKARTQVTRLAVTVSTLSSPSRLVQGFLVFLLKAALEREVPVPRHAVL